MTVVGVGLKRFLFQVGELKMLDVEVKADSVQDACRFITSGDVLKEFPAWLSKELFGEEFTFIRELTD